MLGVGNMAFFFFYTSDPKETALGNIVTFQLLGKQQNDSK